MTTEMQHAAARAYERGNILNWSSATAAEKDAWLAGRDAAVAAAGPPPEDAPVEDDFGWARALRAARGAAAPVVDARPAARASFALPIDAGALTVSAAEAEAGWDAAFAKARRARLRG